MLKAPWKERQPLRLEAWQLPPLELELRALQEPRAWPAVQWLQLPLLSCLPGPPNKDSSTSLQRLHLAQKPLPLSFT